MLAGGNRGQEILGLDDDLVLIARAMAGAEAEWLIVGVLGTCQDLGEALPAGPRIALVEPQGVLVFLVETDRTLRAEDLVDVAHLAAGRDAADEELAHGAIGEAAHDLRLVVVRHRFRSVRAGPRLVDGLDLRHQRNDGSRQRERCIEDVRRQIAHVAAGPALSAPVSRGMRIGKEILGVFAAKPGDLADFTGGDDLSGKLRGGRSDVVETGHVDAAAAIGGGYHFAAFGKACAERLFAEHVLAEREGRQSNFAVRVLRTGDDDRLHIRIVDEHAPVGGRACKAELAGLVRRAGLAGRADHFQPWPQSGVEHRGDRVHGDGMGFAHVSATDNADADSTHEIPLRSTPQQRLPSPQTVSRLARQYRRERLRGMALSRIARNKFLVVGRAGMDLYADPPGTRVEEAARFTSALGGSAANIAAGICRLGGAASLLTSVSDDAVGRFTTLEMQRYKIGTTNVRLAGGEARTSLAVVETRLKDTQSVIYRNGAADFQLSKEDVGSVDFSGFGALIVTGTALAVEPSRAACFLAIEMAKAAGMPVVFDIDYRPYSWTDAKEAASVNLVAAQACDVVIGNDAEFDVLAGGAGLKQARELAKTSASIVVYKMGEKGSVTLHAGEEFETGIYRVEALKPTGAGDAFMAGFVTGLAAGLDVNACVLRGSAAAAIVVTRVGCAPAMPLPDGFPASWRSTGFRSERQKCTFLHSTTPTSPSSTWTTRGCRWTTFNIVKLKRGEAFEYRVAGYETGIVPATGTIDIEVEGERFEAIEAQRNSSNKQQPQSPFPFSCPP